MRNRYTWLYLGVAFASAWLAWIACWEWHRRGIAASALEPIVIAGSFGPFLAAGLCTALRDGWRGMLRFYARALRWRMRVFTLLVSLALIPLLAIVVASLFERHGVLPTFTVSWSELPMIYVWLLVLGGPVAEEFGWSFLSDQLDAAMGLPLSTLLLGVVWALWHLPLFLLSVPGLAQRFVPFDAFAFAAVAWRFLFSWAYHRSDRSILTNLLMHNGLNLGLSIVVVIVPTLDNPQPRLWALGVLSGLSALILWVVLPPAVTVTPP